MSENEILVKFMRQRIHHVVDPEWGPLDPRVHAGLPAELRATYEVAKMAAYFEAAERGRGKALIQAYVDDPPELCPPMKKFKPKKGPVIPEEEEPIDPRAIGASLVAVSDLMVNAELADAAREGGRQLMG